jgi:CRP-like cAMP-binding protein
MQEGRVRVGVLSRQGKEATIALLGPGDFLGEIPSGHAMGSHTPEVFNLAQTGILF